MKKYNPEGFSLQIFKDRYAFTPEETWDQACIRVASQMAIAETTDKVEKYKDKFFEILIQNKFVPGGRIWYNSGRPNPQLLNCFVLGNDLDSKEGWGNLLRENIITSMTGGGCGQDFSDVRPKGAEINGHRGMCPGPLELMKGVNAAARMVRSGGGRRAANMISLDLEHPDIIEFLNAKLVQGELDMANVSVLSKKTKKFIKAVKEDLDWELSWKGKYKKNIRAKDLWKIIVENSWKTAEPGFLNWELVNAENNVFYYGDLVTTNPSLRAGTKVLTSTGIYDIENLENEAILVKNLNNEWSPAKCFLSGKDKRLWRITLKNGFEIYATKEHKWAVKTLGGGYAKIQTSELKPKDRLPMWEEENIGFKSTNPGTYDQGFHLGWLYGDGWFGSRENNNKFVGYIFSEKEKYIGDHMVSLVNGWKENKSNLLDNKDGTFGFQITDQKFIENLMETQGLRKKEEGLPSYLWKSSDEYIKGFIDGIFSSDGFVNKDTNNIVLTSKHEKLLKDVQELLSFYGIKSTIRKSTSNSTFPNGTSGNFTRFDLAISATGSVHFSKIFKLKNKDKQERLDKIRDFNKSNSHHKNVMEVVLVEETDLYEDVWDISVYDETHCFKMSHVTTGNCGEQNLFAYDCCDLGHLVLQRFVEDGKVNWHELANTIRLGVRFLDNVLSVNTFPLQEMKEVSAKLRRIGLGVTGLADMLVLLGLRYASKEAETFIRELFHFISKTAYESSVMLAVEKGAFSVCKPDLHVKSGYMKRMPKKIKSLVEEHGIRNCCILTVAPTGTVSILSGNCSSGIEPMFSYAYWRNYWDGEERKRELCFHPLFVEFMEKGKDVSHFVAARELSVRDHMETQKIIQEYIDSSISKTINLPKDYSLEEMSDIWLEYLPFLKGTTFYREGSRGFVDENGTLQEPPLVEIPLEEAKKLYNQSKEVSTILASTNDNCKTGLCEL